MRHWIVLVLFLLGLGTLRVVACGEEPDCMTNADCDDGNPCTSDRCRDVDDWPTHCNVDRPGCTNWRMEDGTPCGSGKVCVDGVCGENLCEGIVCDDGLDCTEDVCIFATGTCRYPDHRDGWPCRDGLCVKGVCGALVDQCSDEDLAIIEAGWEPSIRALNECSQEALSRRTGQVKFVTNCLIERLELTPGEGAPSEECLSCFALRACCRLYQCQWKPVRGGYENIGPCFSLDFDEDWQWNEECAACIDERCQSYVDLCFGGTQ